MPDVGSGERRNAGTVIYKSAVKQTISLSWLKSNTQISREMIFFTFVAERQLRYWAFLLFLQSNF